MIVRRPIHISQTPSVPPRPVVRSKSPDGQIPARPTVHVSRAPVRLPTDPELISLPPIPHVTLGEAVPDQFQHARNELRVPELFCKTILCETISVSLRRVAVEYRGRKKPLPQNAFTPQEYNNCPTIDYPEGEKFGDHPYRRITDDRHATVVRVEKEGETQDVAIMEPGTSCYMSRDRDRSEWVYIPCDENDDWVPTLRLVGHIHGDLIDQQARTESPFLIAFNHATNEKRLLTADEAQRMVSIILVLPFEDKEHCTFVFADQTGVYILEHESSSGLS